MGSKRLAPSPTANPPSPMPVPQQGQQAPSEGLPLGFNPAFASLPAQQPAVLWEQSAPVAAGGLPTDFNPAFFSQPVGSDPSNPFEVSGQQQIKMPPMGGQIGQGGPSVGQGGPAVGGKCPTCGK